MTARRLQAPGRDNAVPFCSQINDYIVLAH